MYTAVMVNTRHTVHAANKCTEPRTIHTILGAEDIAILIKKMVNVESKVCLRLLRKKPV